MKHILETTGWAVMHKEHDSAKAIFQSVTAAAGYARTLNERHKTDKWSVYPWTISEGLFDCE